MKQALGIAAAVLMVGTASACGSGDAPDDATTAEFCTAFYFITGVDSGQAAHDWADRMGEAGTPSNISEEARAGFEVILEAARGIDADATAEDLGEIETSAEDEDKAEAFRVYAQTECGPYIQEHAEELQQQLQEQLGDLVPSDLPS